MDNRGKLKKSGRAEPLLEQELAHLEHIKMFEQVRLEDVGAGQKGSRIALKYLIPIIIFALIAITVPLAMSLINWEGAGEKAGLADEKTEGPVREQKAVIDEGRVSALSARQVAQAFLNAASEEERLALVRDPESIRSGMAAFHEEVRALPIKHDMVQRMGPASASGNMRFERFAVTMPDGRLRLLCVTETPVGPLVDYKSFARYGTADWDELMQGNPGEEVRLVLKPSFYYHHGFSDDERWTAFDLSNPDWPDSLTGYAVKGSPTAKLLTAITSKVRKQRVTLKLRSEQNSHQHRQVVIDKVLASGWVQTDGDIEAKWQLRTNGKSTTSLR